MFTPTSRYVNLEIAKYVTRDRRVIAYVRRRFLPPLVDGTYLEHDVILRDRLDNITAHYLGDPEQFWRVCDVNIKLRPDDLVAEPGRRIRISSLGGI
jgi:hypothetical protein